MEHTQSSLVCQGHKPSLIQDTVFHSNWTRIWGGFPPPNHPFVHRVSHYKPSILGGFPPIFGNTLLGKNYKENKQFFNQTTKRFKSLTNHFLEHEKQAQNPAWIWLIHHYTIIKCDVTRNIHKLKWLEITISIHSFQNWLTNSDSRYITLW